MEVVFTLYYIGNNLDTKSVHVQHKYILGSSWQLLNKEYLQEYNLQI